MAKLTKSLQSFLKNNKQPNVEVVLELSKTGLNEASVNLKGNRKDQILNAKFDFSKQVELVSSTLKLMGGSILGQAWINSTLKVQMPTNSLPKVADMDFVESIDLPQSIHQE